MHGWKEICYIKLTVYVSFIIWNTILNKPHNTNIPTYSFLPFSAGCLFHLLQVTLVNAFLQGVEEVKEVTQVVKAVVIVAVSSS